MTVGPEYTEVEKPLIDQLTSMGWTHLEGAPPGGVRPSDPAKSGRTSFSEVFLEDRLRAQIRRINKGPDGKPWLDDRRISQAVSALTRTAAASLLEANQKATDLLLNGTTVEGLPGWNGGRDQRIHYIDWENWDKPAANDFVVVSQFRVDIPGVQNRCIVPDEVLFVNGIPLALIECKQPDSQLKTAIDQHFRYAERRPAQAREGNEKLFHTIQLLVATCGDKARLGSITSGAEHYATWSDPYPFKTTGELADRLGKPENAVTPQDILVGIVLHPARLLDITHNYVAFMETDSGKMIKAVPRYQQYRAVGRAIERLENNPTRSQSDDGEDHRGGVIWHTQGSGKSLTMSFLVRKMRTVPGLRKTKVVIITDRDQLQKQLGDTLELTGEPVTVTTKTRQAHRELAQHGPGIICVMIQKQQDLKARKKKLSDEVILEGRAPGFPELNADESIVLLIDEAHRSHASTLHGNLMDALPNAARIGFTGTPILMGKKTWTTTTFGPYIDIYRLADAERDGAVVPILYAGRKVKGAVRDGDDMDEVFEDLLDDLTPKQIEKIKRRYATKAEIMEATEVIAAKAKNMLRHYIETVLPNGYKAQVAAHSRKAAVRYRDALIDARDAYIRKNAGKLPPDVIEKVKRLDFIPVISPGENDPEAWSAWTDTDRQDQAIAAFKDPEKQPAFLIVKSMLLTGFDAPVEQVLYLDRSMKEAELLQAVARVNRPATSVGGAPKAHGYVIDYAGVTDDLTKALKAYAAEDVAGVLTDIETDYIAALRARLTRLKNVFLHNGVTPGTSDEAQENCVQLLSDGPLRDQFETELRLFLSAVDTVMPRKEARPFTDAARLFAEIAAKARRRYREDGNFDPSLYGEKIRELIDEHMTALGIAQVLPPMSITDPEYQRKAARLGVRARVSEMEHAIRHHISVHMDEDPVRYRRLSEHLEEILAEHQDDWDQRAQALSAFLKKIQDEDSGTDSGDSPVASRLKAAMYRLLLEETSDDGVITEETEARLAAFCRHCHQLAVARNQRPDFWRHEVDQHDFTMEIAEQLDLQHVCPGDDADTLAYKLVDIIRANRGNLQPQD